MTGPAHLRRPRRRARTLCLLLVAIVSMSGIASCAKSPHKAADPATSLLTDIVKRGTLNVGVRADDPPHGFTDSQGNLVGFDVDIAQAIGKSLGVKVNFVKVDELTRISFLQNGRIDLAAASISETQQRAKQVDFSETYFFSTKSFLVKKGGTIHSLQDLVGKTVGADRGSNAPAQWNDWLSHHGSPAPANVVLFSDKHAAESAVAQGSVSGWMEDYEIVASFAKNDPSVEVLNTPEPFGTKMDGIAMHKNDSDLRLAVNTALQQITSSGQYDTIYNRWFGPGASTPVPRQGTIEVWPNA